MTSLLTHCDRDAQAAIDRRDAIGLPGRGEPGPVTMEPATPPPRLPRRGADAPMTRSASRFEPKPMVLITEAVRASRW
jgi:hypothetical protein